MIRDKITDGAMVKHKYIPCMLTVVADEKGPAYTDNEFKDDEISLSYALIEFDHGCITEIIPAQ